MTGLTPPISQQDSKTDFVRRDGNIVTLIDLTPHEAVFSDHKTRNRHGYFEGDESPFDIVARVKSEVA